MNSTMKKLFTILFILILGLVLYIHFSGNNHIYKALASTYLVGETGPGIDDYTKFYNRKVEAGKPQSWHLSKNYNKFELTDANLKIIEDYETVAFLIIHRDSILFEKYWDGYSEESLTNSFSVAKSFVSIALGVAIKEGIIKSLTQKVGEFLPEFSEGDKSLISIKDLLTMSSGINFGESYNDPWGFMSKTYYGKNLYELSIEKEVQYAPGEVWKYQGGNTLLLSFIIEKASGMSLSDFFSKHIWKEIGASEDALWTLNEENGLEKAYCCFYSNARDFARIGKLYLQNGRWGKDTLVPYWYVRESVLPVNINDEENQLVDHYGYHWWLANVKAQKIFYARGIQGQYITVLPIDEIVLVRLGRKRDPGLNEIIPKDLLEYIRMAQFIASKNT